MDAMPIIGDGQYYTVRSRDGFSPSGPQRWSASLQQIFDRFVELELEPEILVWEPRILDVKAEA